MNNNLASHSIYQIYRVCIEGHVDIYLKVISIHCRQCLRCISFSDGGIYLMSLTYTFCMTTIFAVWAGLLIGGSTACTLGAALHAHLISRYT